MFWGCLLSVATAGALAGNSALSQVYDRLDLFQCDVAFSFLCLGNLTAVPIANAKHYAISSYFSCFLSRRLSTVYSINFFLLSYYFSVGSCLACDGYVLHSYFSASFM